jgi:hypothetical protein
MNHGWQRGAVGRFFFHFVYGGIVIHDFRRKIFPNEDLQGKILTEKRFWRILKTTLRFIAKKRLWSALSEGLLRRERR